MWITMIARMKKKRYNFSMKIEAWNWLSGGTFGLIGPGI